MAAEQHLEQPETPDGRLAAGTAHIPGVACAHLPPAGCRKMVPRSGQVQGPIGRPPMGISRPARHGEMLGRGCGSGRPEGSSSPAGCRELLMVR